MQNTVQSANNYLKISKKCAQTKINKKQTENTYLAYIIFYFIKNKDYIIIAICIFQIKTKFNFKNYFINM